MTEIEILPSAPMTEIETEPEITETQPEPEILPENKLTDEQLDVGVNNCKQIFDPDNKLTEKELFQFLQIDGFSKDPLVLHVLLVQTAQFFFEKMGGDEKENLATLQLICDYVKNSDKKEQLEELALRTFQMICSPIHYKENPAFIQIWTDILNMAIQWKFPDFCAQNSK